MKFLVFRGKLVLLLLIISFANAEETINDVDISDVNIILEFISNPQMKIIGETLLEVEAEIKTLNSSIGTSVTPTTVFKNFGYFGREFLNLRNRMTDLKISADDYFHKISLALFKKMYLVLCGQLIEIRKSFKEDFRIRALKAITDHQFKEAEDIWVFLDDNSAICKVIREICANNTEDVDLLLEFTKSLDTIDRKFFVINSLRKDLQILDRLDLLSEVKLLYSLESEILNQEEINDTQFADAIIYYNTLRVTLKNNATEMMTSAMLAHKFESDEKIKEFLFKSYNLHQIISNEILFEVIDRVFGKITNKELLNNIIFQCNSPQLEDALVYIYEKLKKAKQLDSVIFHLAQYVHQLAYPKDVSVSKRQKDLESIWNSLPNAVKILYKARSVCFKNVEVSEYLYAASDAFRFDNNRRPVFTWVPGIKVTQGIWYVEKDSRSDDFYFVNKVHCNEYMYASDDSIGKKQDFGYVFTWRQQGRVDSNKSAWRLEISGNYVRIRSVYNKKLLCVTSNTYPQNQNYDRRYALTVRKELFVFDKSCLWHLEACE